MSQLSLKKIKLGDNADTSKNFVISVPAVADGTLTIERENGTDVLTIDASNNIRAASGAVLAINGPCFAVYKTSTQALSANSSAKVTFQASVSGFPSDYDFANNRFKPTVAGYYQLSARIGWSTNAAAVCWLFKNGAAALSGGYFENSCKGLSVSGLLYLNGTTDYAEFYVQESVTQNTEATEEGAYFHGFLARAA